jgi:hypothetical protein
MVRLNSLVRCVLRSVFTIEVCKIAVCEGQHWIEWTNINIVDATATPALHLAGLHFPTRPQAAARPVFKIVVAGVPGVGKTAFCSRFSSYRLLDADEDDRAPSPDIAQVGMGCGGVWGRGAGGGRAAWVLLHTHAPSRLVVAQVYELDVTTTAGGVTLHLWDPAFDLMTANDETLVPF